MSIQAYGPLSGITSGTKMQDVGKSESGNNNFAAVLKNYTEQLNHTEKQADTAAQNLATGKGGNTSETLLAIEKADISFQMMMGVRNKLVDAYHEISRMQV